MDFAHDSSEHNRALDSAGGTEAELQRLIDQGEHQCLDFKFRVDSSAKIAKTLSAFANTDGGKLLIGVKDNGRITGIDPEEEFYMIEGAAELYCKPLVKFTSRVYESEDKLVLEIYVPPSPDKPHFAKDGDRWIAFVRQNDENFAANKVLLRYLRDKKPNQRKNLIAYGTEERQLFDYLSAHSDISVSKFSRLANIPIYRAEKILSLLLKWEVIGWQASDKGIRFSLVE